MEKRNVIITLVIFVALCVLSVMIIYSPNARKNVNTNEVNTVQESIAEEEISEESSLPTEKLHDEVVTQDVNEETTASTENVLDKINKAKSVTIREEIISLNKSYDIYADGKKIANVSGKYISLTGDVFTLKDNSGKVLMSEKQIKRWGLKLNRAAQIYDADGNTIRLLWRG